MAIPLKFATYVLSPLVSSMKVSVVATISPEIFSVQLRNIKPSLGVTLHVIGPSAMPPPLTIPASLGLV